MNLFALTREASRRIVRIPLSSEVQDEVIENFSQQEQQFRASAEEQVAFDGKYKPDDGECLFIDGYDDIDNLHWAIANPLSLPEISPVTSEFEEIKALFVGRADGDNRVALIQAFDRRKILSTKGLSLFYATNVFRKVEGVGLTLGTGLSAILDNGKLSFFSFHAARQIFDLTQYFMEATDDDLKEFAANGAIKVADPAAFIAASDTWVRRKVALVMQSGILDKIDLIATKQTATVFGIDFQTATDGEKVALVLPGSKADLKKLLRFLDEDYFQSVLSSTPHLSNSKRRV